MIRYGIGVVIAAAGGLAGPIAADALDATGIAAYGLFLAGVAAFIPIAGLVAGDPPPRRLARTQHR